MDKSGRLSIEEFKPLFKNLIKNSIKKIEEELQNI